MAFVLPPPPSGWRASVLRDGDTLARLEGDAGISALVIMAGNGVANPGRKTCSWGNAVGDVVLSVGGFVLGGAGRDRALCGRDCSFRAGNVINLPAGVRPPASSSPSPPTKSRVGGGLLALLLLGAAALFGSKG